MNNQQEELVARITVASAAKMLSVGTATVRALIRTDTLTPLRPSGIKGVGRRVYLDPREVELYGRGKFEELAAYKAAKKAEAA